MPGEWYNITADESLDKLGSSLEGLSGEEAKKRLAKYGPNQLVQTQKTSPLQIFLKQFSNLLIGILIMAAVISGLLGEWIDTAVILVIVILNAVLGFYQEYRAERALEALKVLAAPRSKVIRKGDVQSIRAEELVPGDVIMLEAGDKVPADLRMMETASLRINEAPLTGESVTVSKTTEALPGDVFLGDRKNMAYLGCSVEVGKGKGLVVSTGMSTELGKIAGLVQAEPDTKTPLQRQLDSLGKQLGAVILMLVVVIFVVEYLVRPESDLVNLFLMSISLAVAAIPEGLPAVVTVSLALGLQRMAKRHALLRRLPAVETLGSASVICTDKTGTLTRGEMNTVAIHAGGIDYVVEGEGFDPQGRILRSGMKVDLAKEPELAALLGTGLLCSDAIVRKAEKGWSVVGDTTEGAIIVAGMRGGLSKEVMEEQMPRAAEVPFTSERKMMSTVHAPLDKEFHKSLKSMSEQERLALLGEMPRKVVHVKGAPERVLRACSQIMKDGKIQPLTENDRHQLVYSNQELASRGLRVLGFAYKELPLRFTNFTEQSLEKELIFLGFMGMIDSPRKDAVEALKECRKAGIDVVMITGDHKLTAMAVAADMGILEKGQKALTGEELSKLSDQQLLEVVEEVRVYARVSPQDKLRILRAWKTTGHIVVMTGDGVNDAPALRSSDLGVSMGITGTDVAKESSDMVLTDDNFASIVGAVEEGRGIYINIRKFVRYLLSTNSGEVLTIFLAAVFLLPLPLIPLQILWINLITDGLPGVALSAEPKEAGLMRQKPRDPKKGIVSGTVPLDIIWVGMLMTFGSLSLFAWSLGSSNDLEKARTLVFFTLTMFQMFHVLAIRVEWDSVFRAGFFRNKLLILAVLSTVALQFAVIYVPFLSRPFETRPLAWEELAIATLVASSVFIAVEIEKFILRCLEARRLMGQSCLVKPDDSD